MAVEWRWADDMKALLPEEHVDGPLDGRPSREADGRPEPEHELCESVVGGMGGARAMG